ncbi:MAG: M1 family metallopeptidase, partial [Candidatus Binataceae bacterium]
MHDQENPTAVDTAAELRLPSFVKPERYELRIAPDLTAAEFAGEETVTLKIEQLTSDIVLHALELTLHEITIERGGKRITGTAEMIPAFEQARIRFAQELEPGQWILRIGFSGILNDKLHGFYRSQYQDSSGAAHLIAATQFEATDARRAFPCWDEPALKARFKVRLVIDDKLTAISNGGIEQELKAGGGRKEIVFRETIPMSTYLVAFIVGQFELTEPTDAGAPLRVAHVPGKNLLTGWARQIGAFSLRFFAEYYELPYPGDKLDLIAIPDFASGAMENLGAITFRETALLVDERSASRAELERVADVVSHENAHMWFGDLVTMKWWNGIWLNEAFATFMEMLAVDNWKPNWKRWESFSVSRTAAMAIDGLSATRAIEYPVHTPEDARAMFDLLTYEKGAAVLRMLEQYLGGEEFRKGIALYLKKHQYANAETGDLWDALEESSRQPVRKLMDSWIFQPGFPIIEVAAGGDGKVLTLKQERFYYLPQAERNSQLWHAPLIVRVKSGGKISSRKLLMTEAARKIEFAEPVEWALVNEGGHGFYRAAYSSDMLAAILHNLVELKPIERFGLVSDTWAATVAGHKPIDEFISLARLLSGETDINVWRALIGAFHYLDLIIDEADRPALAAKVRAITGPAFARLGWEPRANEDELTRQLRGMLANVTGTLGQDAKIQARAAELFHDYHINPKGADRDVIPALAAIAAYCGDARRYEEFKQYFKSAGTPQEEQRYLFSLAGFTRLDLLRNTMDMTLDGQVRTQNAPYLMHSLLLNPICRYEAWDFVRKFWDSMCAKFPDSALPRMCEAVSGLLDRQVEVNEFFEQH